LQKKKKKEPWDEAAILAKLRLKGDSPFQHFSEVRITRVFQEIGKPDHVKLGFFLSFFFAIKKSKNFFK